MANRAGVSRTTVSLVLNNRADSIPEETRRRVLEAAASLGYVPSAAGRALRKGGSDLILVIQAGGEAADLSDSMWQACAQGFQERGLTTVFSRTAGMTTPLRTLLQELRPRAILSLVPLSPGDSSLVSALGIPLVAPGSDHEASFDELQRALGVMQASYLLSHGRRRLVYASSDALPSDGAVLLERRSAFISTVSDSDGAVLVGTIHCDPHSPRSVENLCDQLDGLARTHACSFDAVAAFNDDVAAACLRALARLGRQVPRDVCVIGVGNLALGQYLNPALTTIELDAQGAWTQQVVETVMEVIAAQQHTGTDDHRQPGRADAQRQPAGTYPRQQPGRAAPRQQPSGSHLPQQPSGSHLPQQPGGSHLPQQPSGSHLPQQPGGSHLRQQPGGSHLPQQPGGSHLRQQPGGSYLRQQPGGTGTRQRSTGHLSWAQSASQPASLPTLQPGEEELLASETDEVRDPVSENAGIDVLMPGLRVVVRESA
ncbi:MAG: substrate-binding domain-containing protein [Actinomyces urogenitalis]|uniref:LacI family DNA-binding transcriptional regulator n=2 Tax=Actinomyces urogenitalis TaxID=103621 RepID=UPI0025515040|nr:LacI family DNA-binding transcriptional regulator [Actinomyces urogenitalis]MBS6071125.1 substrate-binding domain-containing protein [Actinomyces urogenitalis]